MARTKQSARKTTTAALRSKKVLASSGPLKKSGARASFVKAEPVIVDEAGPSTRGPGRSPKKTKTLRRVKREPENKPRRTLTGATLKRRAKNGAVALR
eukprot:355792-Chlamydomonas_euryale.AAC.6